MREATMATGWLSREVSDLRENAKMGSPIVDELILGPSALGWTASDLSTCWPVVALCSTGDAPRYYVPPSYVAGLIPTMQLDRC